VAGLARVGRRAEWFVPQAAVRLVDLKLLAAVLVESEAQREVRSAPQAEPARAPEQRAVA
jgi:hypothetical protein